MKNIPRQFYLLFAPSLTVYVHKASGSCKMIKARKKRFMSTLVRLGQKPEAELLFVVCWKACKVYIRNVSGDIRVRDRS